MRTGLQNVVRRLDGGGGNVVRPSWNLRPQAGIVAEAGRDERTTYPRREDGRKVELHRVIRPPLYLVAGIDQRLH